jgi:hypothetical protein
MQTIILTFKLEVPDEYSFKQQEMIREIAEHAGYDGIVSRLYDEGLEDVAETIQVI